MAPMLSNAVVARQLVPAALEIPNGTDPMTFLLSLPGMGAENIPPGADRTMTTDGPDQIWYLVVAITCIAIPGLFLIVRIYTKLVVVRSLEVADYFIFLAFPLIVVEIAMGYYMVKWGAGVHQWQVTLGQLFNQLYWANIAQIIYCPLSFVVKMAILLQYLRLFAPSRSVNRVMWYGAWVTIASCFILYTFFMFWTMFYCKPRRMIWDKLTPGGKCHDVNDIILSQGAFNMASDIIILLLPTSSLWTLNVPLGRKIAVTLLFATGLLACAASAMRIVFTVKIAPVISMADVSHNGLFIGLWTEAEVSLGFIVACSLCLPKLIQAKGKKFRMALTYASSPFSTLRTTISSRSRSRSRSGRSGTWSGSRKSTQATSRSSQQAMQMQEMGGKRPIYYEEREIQQQQELARASGVKKQPDAHVLPSQGSSEYSQSIKSKHTSDGGDSMIPAPLNVPNSSGSDQSQASNSRTVHHRLTREQMTPEQIQAELYALQQFNFESFRQSLEEDRRRSRRYSSMLQELYFDSFQDSVVNEDRIRHSRHSRLTLYG